MQILIQHDSEQLGPFSESDARSQLATGACSPADPAWHDGLDDWTPLDEVLRSVVALRCPVETKCEPRRLSTAEILTPSLEKPPLSARVGSDLYRFSRAFRMRERRIRIARTSLKSSGL